MRTGFTNAERGDLIDALQLAIKQLKTTLRANFSALVFKDRGRGLDDSQREDWVEWRAQIYRYRKLRQQLLSEERESLARFSAENKRRSS